MEILLIVPIVLMLIFWRVASVNFEKRKISNFVLKEQGAREITAISLQPSVHSGRVYLVDYFDQEGMRQVIHATTSVGGVVFLSS